MWYKCGINRTFLNFLFCFTISFLQVLISFAGNPAIVKLSKKYGIPMADIQKANPNLNWDDVPIGHDITIPGGIAGVNDKVNEYL